MKNDMKKYLSLGVVLAGSALMISCDDGSDGKDGADGTDAVTNLPVEAPAKDLFTLSKLRFIVDPVDAVTGVELPGSDDWTGSPEIRLDFASPYGGEMVSYLGYNTYQTAVRTVNLQSPVGADGTQFTIDEIVEQYGGLADADTVEWESGDIRKFKNMVFTVTESSQLSLTGDWTASGTMADEVQLSKQESNSVGITATSPADAQLGTVFAYVNTAGNDVTIQTLDEDVLYELKDNEVALQYITTEGVDVIYIWQPAVMPTPDGGTDLDVIPAVGGEHEFLGLNTPVFTSDDERTLITGAVESEVNVRGTFRWDMDSSYGGSQPIDVND